MPLNDESKRDRARDGQAAPRHGRHAAPASSQGRARQRAAGQAQPHARSHARQAQAPTGASSAWGSADRQRVAYHERESQGQNLPLADLANNSDVDPMEQAAPRPVLDPAATGSFRRIDPSEGAVVTTRANAQETAQFSVAAIEAEQRRLQGKARPKVRRQEPARQKASRPMVIGIIVAAAVVVALVAFLVVRAINSERARNQGQTVEQTQVAADGSIDYRGTTYSLAQQEDGKYALVSVPDSDETGQEGSQTVYFEFDGTPVQLVLYNGAIIVPENLDGSWDVMAYTIGAGGLPTQVVDSDGNAITGQGQIDHVELQDSNLVVTDTDGNATTVPLA